MTAKHRGSVFSTYITERMNGFGGESRRRPSLDQIKFPEFADFMMRQIGVSDELAKVWNAPQAVNKLEYDPTLAEAKTESAAPVAPLRTVLVTWTMDLRERPLHIERTVNEHKREIVRDLAI
jgi:hypothetical protein